MEQIELEKIIDEARRGTLTELYLRYKKLTSLPESIGNLSNLTTLYLGENQLIILPESIGNLSNLTKLDLCGNKLTSLPESIGNLSNLTKLDLRYNQLTSLPESIGNLSNLTDLLLDNNRLTSLPESIGNLSNLTKLDLVKNQLTSLPEWIGNLSNLTALFLSSNQLTSLPEWIGNLSNLTWLFLRDNQLNSLPESIGNLSNLRYLHLGDNQLTSLPKWIGNLYLAGLYLTGNPFVDLSIVQSIVYLEDVNFFGVYLPRRYWTKLSDWKPEWLLDEDNAEIRRILIQQVGYEKILEELNSLTLDTWREYTLLKIDGIEAIYDNEDELTYEREPMVLLKMTCPSTAHIHILRVPPEMVSAEAAITWVNHGIHPDSFAVQT